MAEGARLESVFTRKGNVGSNPTLSASFKRLSSPSNQFAISLRGRASPTTFECACAISSVTTSP